MRMKRAQRLEWLMAAQSTALALGNLLLAAHHEGLAACWMCAPLFAPDIVRDVLDLPADWEPQALITLGYPAETREKDEKAGGGGGRVAIETTQGRRDAGTQGATPASSP